MITLDEKKSPAYDITAIEDASIEFEDGVVVTASQNVVSRTKSLVSNNRWKIENLGRPGHFLPLDGL